MQARKALLVHLHVCCGVLFDTLVFLLMHEYMHVVTAGC